MRLLAGVLLLVTGALAPGVAAADGGFLDLPADNSSLAVAVRGPSVQLEPPPTAPVIVDQGAPPVPEEDFAGSSEYRNGRCVGWEPMLARYSPGWSVERMSRLMYRESRCGPRAWNRRGQAAGLLQVTPITYRFLAGCLGESVSSAKLFVPAFNIRAAACLWRENGYSPWAL